MDSFSAIKNALTEQLHSLLRLKDSPSRKFLPSGAARSLFVNSKLQLERLYILGSPHGDEEETLARAAGFLRAVLGDDNDTALANFLATLLYMNIDANSGAWLRFEDLCLRSSFPLHLTDGNLPLSLQGVRSFFGENNRDTHMFFDFQFIFAPLVLYKNKALVCTGDRESSRMPILEETKIGRGSIGKVFKVKIARGHLAPPSSSDASEDFICAKKVFKLSGAIRSFRQQDQDHPITDWSTIDHRNICSTFACVETPTALTYFLQLADCNLETLLRDLRNDPKNLRHRSERVRQLSGVISAVSYLHNGLHVRSTFRQPVSGFQLDLDLRDILVFGLGSDDETLKIQCLDLFFFEASGRMQPQRHRDSPRKSLYGDSSPATPPEGFASGEVTASVDIWQLGCLLCRFTAWLQDGGTGLAAFDEARFNRQNSGDWYWTSTGHKTRPKPRDRIYVREVESIDGRNFSSFSLNTNVTTWFEELLKRTKGAPEYRLYCDLWQLINSGMLVLDPGQRLRIEKVHVGMLEIIRDTIGASDQEPREPLRPAYSQDEPASLPGATFSIEKESGLQDEISPRRAAPTVSFDDSAMSLMRATLHDDGEAAQVSQNLHDIAGSSTSFYDSGIGSMKSRSVQVEEHEQTEFDRQTIRSHAETIRIDLGLKTRLVAAFVQELVANLGIQQISGDIDTTAIGDHLAEILRFFCETLTVDARPGLEMKGTEFIRQQRGRIKNEIVFRLTGADADQSEEENPSRPSSPGIPASEKVEDFLQHSDHPEPEPSQSDSTAMSQFEPGDGAIDEEDTSAPTEDLEHLLQYFGLSKSFITEAPAYEVLLEQMRGLLSPFSSVRLCSEILYPCLQSVGSSLTMTFVVQWDPLSFLQDQYNSQEPTLLSQVITLTSDADYVQAAASSQYAEHAWSDSEVSVLEELQAYLEEGESDGQPEPSMTSNFSQDEDQACKLSFRMIAELRCFIVVAHGSRRTLVSVAEQLCWLGSACRASSDPNEICYTTPNMRVVNEPNESLGIEPRHVIIGFDEKAYSPSDTELHDQADCWKLLFRNPSVAYGFQIAERTGKDQFGLEIPLNIMSMLGEVERFAYHDNKTVLKGFMSMFYPTATCEGSVTWHFLVNRDGSYMPFQDEIPGISINEPTIPTSRHFVGWVSTTRSRLGAENVDYKSIRHSKQTTPAGPGCALQNVSLSISKVAGGGVAFTRGSKDKAHYFPGDLSYGAKVAQMRRTYVNLFDDEERRGWLVDGAGAIVHLLRAHFAVPPCSQSRYLQISEFKHTDAFKSSFDGLSAEQQVLLDEGNRALKWDEDWDYVETPNGKGKSGQEANRIQRRKVSKIWTIEHIVCHFWNVLDDLGKKQDQIKSTYLRGTTRDKLEGWSMKEIIDNDPHLDPHVLYLKPSGRGWVDFLRDIKAVTLFGRGLGDLIVPSKDGCEHWQTVPLDQDYLTVRVGDLLSICERYGDESSTPLRLSKSSYWHQADKLFEPCSCSNEPHKKRCDRVQVLLPELTMGFKSTPSPWMYRDGAVILGRSHRKPFWWPTSGRPIEGESPEESNAMSKKERLTIATLWKSKWKIR